MIIDLNQRLADLIRAAIETDNYQRVAELSSRHQVMATKEIIENRNVIRQIDDAFPPAHVGSMG